MEMPINYYFGNTDTYVYSHTHVCTQAHTHICRVNGLGSGFVVNLPYSLLQQWWVLGLLYFSRSNSAVPNPASGMPFSKNISQYVTALPCGDPEDI